MSKEKIHKTYNFEVLCIFTYNLIIRILYKTIRLFTHFYLIYIIYLALWICFYFSTALTGSR